MVKVYGKERKEALSAKKYVPLKESFILPQWCDNIQTEGYLKNLVNNM